MEKWFGIPFLEEYKGLNLKYLPLNRAYVLVNTTFEEGGVYSVDRNCYKCPYELVQKFSANEESSFEVDTSTEKSWRILNTGDWMYLADNYKEGLICEERPTFGEFGVYRLNVGMCNLDTEVEPINSYLPLQLFGLILLALFIIYMATKRIVKRRKTESIEINQINLKIIKHEDKTRALHFFRGLLMLVIIFTTCGGGGYPIFYRKFRGISIPDIVFYVLSWTLGVYIPQAIDDSLCSGRKKWRIIADICLRSIIMIFACMIMESLGIFSISPDTLWSPLKRIGIAYCIAASTYAITNKRIEKTVEKFIHKVGSTIYTLLWSWILFGLILTGLVVSMFIFASFNCVGDIGLTEHKANHSDSETEVLVYCENNYTDSANMIFLADKSWMVDVKSYVGFSGGLLGTLSTILFTLIGLKTGVILAHFDSQSDRFKLWTTWAVFFGAIGFVLAAIPQPDSYNLWPIATIFTISSLSTYILMFISWKTSHQQQDNISPVLSLGFSFLPILFGHLLFSKCIPFSFDMNLNCHFWYLLENLYTILLWVIIAMVLMRKNIGLTM